MNKNEIIAFFNQRAQNWDAHMVKSEEKINHILDIAKIRPGISVLDVACGTGVLFADYLARNVSKVTGVDISPEMSRIAALKFRDPRIEVLCGDIETVNLPYRYDCCVVYNAFPHFTNPPELLSRLSLLLVPGGRLTIAHGMSLQKLHEHHSHAARHVSRRMLPPEELASLMPPALTVDTQISDAEKYVVSARLGG